MMDKVNLRIVKALSQNARLTYAQIAKQVHLSAPAVAERIRKLEESGVITGYKPSFDLEKLGINIEALVECNVHSSKERAFRKVLLNLEEVIKIYSVTGDSEFIVHIGVSKMSELEAVIEGMLEYTETNTKMVLSMPQDDVLPKKLERLASC